MIVTGFGSGQLDLRGRTSPTRAPQRIAAARMTADERAPLCVGRPVSCRCSAWLTCWWWPNLDWCMATCVGATTTC